VLPYFSFIDKRATLEQRVRLEQHFADIFEALSAGVPDAIQVLDVSEIDEQRCDVSRDLHVSNASGSDQMFVDKFREEPIERMIGSDAHDSLDAGRSPRVSV
jgi:hypothetical protein